MDRKANVWRPDPNGIVNPGRGQKAVTDAGRIDHVLQLGHDAVVIDKRGLIERAAGVRAVRAADDVIINVDRKAELMSLKVEPVPSEPRSCIVPSLFLGGDHGPGGGAGGGVG